MTKLNLELKEQKIVKGLLPEGEGKLFQVLESKITVSEETRQGKTYWIADVPLSPKDRKERDASLSDPPHYFSEFHIERSRDGKDYLVVDPQLSCGVADNLCRYLAPNVIRFRDNLRGNPAIPSFVHEIMKRDPKDLSIISGAEWMVMQSKGSNDSTVSWGEAALFGGIGMGLVGGLGALFYLLKRRQARQSPITFSIGKEPGEGGVGVDSKSELRNALSRKQILITFKPDTGKYFALHQGTNPTYVGDSQGNGILLSSKSPTELTPGDILVVREHGGKNREILRILFNPKPKDKNPRSAFLVSEKIATGVDSSPRLNQGVLVPPPIDKGATSRTSVPRKLLSFIHPL
jgi:hypothetical protein